MPTGIGRSLESAPRGTRNDPMRTISMHVTNATAHHTDSVSGRVSTCRHTSSPDLSSAARKRLISLYSQKPTPCCSVASEASGIVKEWQQIVKGWANGSGEHGCGNLGGMGAVNYGGAERAVLMAVPVEDLGVEQAAIPVRQ